MDIDGTRNTAGKPLRYQTFWRTFHFGVNDKRKIIDDVSLSNLLTISESHRKRRQQLLDQNLVEENQHFAI